MIKFERYPHINDLFQHYIDEIGNAEIKGIMNNGVTSMQEAKIFSEFVWRMVERINEDEEAGNTVLGSSDNTEMLPDLSYEITKYMRKVGFYSIWEKISETNID